MPLTDSVYTPAKAVTEIMDMYIKHKKLYTSRLMRLKKGEISTRSKDELDARDSDAMRELLESFIYTR